MSEDVIKEPSDFLEYLGVETGNLLVSLNNHRTEFEMFSRLDALYRTAFRDGRVDSADDLIIPQLLLLVHYHYYHSTATLLRCHLSDALASMRTAIEAGLTAYRIIEDRPSQLKYVQRDKSFQSHKRFFTKVWKTDPDTFTLAPPLINRWDACSQYGSHADIDTFVHRLDLPDVASRMLRLHYFQHPRNRYEFGWYFLLLVHTFVIILHIFEKYLVREKALLPEAWGRSISQVGKNAEELMKEARRRADEEKA